MKCFKTALIISLLFSSVSQITLAADQKEIPHPREGVVYSYAPIVKVVAPAVVNIYTLQHPKANKSTSPFLDDPFFKQFLGRINPEKDRDQISLGSGVIINKDGYILTNYHVIKDADQIEVALSDKRQFIAKTIVQDKRTDLALLKIDAKGDLPFLKVDNQENLEVGDIVLAIGNPFGIGQTVTSGMVSALARSQQGIGDIHSFIQTDAAINPGNSGGPLVRTDGRLVGINTAIYSKSGGSMGIGFAIPTTLALPLIESLKNGGHIVRPWIGLDVVQLSVDGAKKLNMDHLYGVVIKSVYPNGPGQKAGLKEGDIITAIDGFEIDDKDTLDYRVAIAPVGKSATIKFFRNGDENTLSVQFVAPPESTDPLPFAIDGLTPLQGAKMRILSPALALDLGLNPMKTGVVITEVSKDGAANDVGLRPGDVLVSINTQKVLTKQDAVTLVKAQAKSWDLVVSRGQKLVYLQVKGP